MYNSKLRGLIINAGLTQYEFASKVGIGYATISRIINNKHRVREEHQQAIADYFGKKTNVLFNRSVRRKL
jgi:transcriptional regulator with XRE-family HTH domain